jgi:hypothetical protein
MRIRCLGKVFTESFLNSGGSVRIEELLGKGVFCWGRPETV